MHYIVYKITNTINKRFYIGAHSALVLEDGYMGSGKNLLAAFRKYGRENFSREILSVHASAKEMFEAEKLAVKEAKLNRLCYNITEGGVGRCGDGRALTQEHRAKISKSLKGKSYRQRNPVHTEKLAKPRRGVPLPEDWRAKIREGMRRVKENK